MRGVWGRCGLRSFLPGCCLYPLTATTLPLLQIQPIKSSNWAILQTPCFLVRPRKESGAPSCASQEWAPSFWEGYFQALLSVDFVSVMRGTSGVSLVWFPAAILYSHLYIYKYTKINIYIYIFFNIFGGFEIDIQVYSSVLLNSGPGSVHILPFRDHFCRTDIL